jgi:hypothetical protein
MLSFSNCATEFKTAILLNPKVVPAPVASSIVPSHNKTSGVAVTHICL